MKTVTIDALIPAQRCFTGKRALNVLLVANNPDEASCRAVFRFYANDSRGWREIYAQEKELAPGGHSHLYFLLPAECFGAALWGQQPEELTLRAAFAPPEEDGGIMLYYAPDDDE